MQFFKGDELEQKFYESAGSVMSTYSAEKDEFFDEAYACHLLGEILYDDNRSPLANAIKREIFRESFSVIFEAFLTAGSLESYLVVFRKIFGDDVVVDFTIPAPGKLNIDIEAQGVEFSDFIARYILDNTYIFDEIIDDEGDNIAFQTIKGFQSQYELEQMLFEMVPGGIYTQITLTLGGA